MDIEYITANIMVKVGLPKETIDKWVALAGNNYPVSLLPKIKGGLYNDHLIKDIKDAFLRSEYDDKYNKVKFTGKKSRRFTATYATLSNGFTYRSRYTDGYGNVIVTKLGNINNLHDMSLTTELEQGIEYIYIT